MQGFGIARSMAAIALTASFAGPSIARPQSDTTAGHHGVHFALGGAEATTVGACSGCTGFGQLGTEYSLMLRVGGAVSPNVVVSADLSAWEFDRKRGSESGQWELVTAQYYPSLQRGLFVSAGIGLAQFQYDGLRSVDGLNEFSGRNGLGLTGGVGYDLHVSGAFFLSPSIDVLYLQQIGAARGIRQTPAVVPREFSSSGNRTGRSRAKSPRNTKGITDSRSRWASAKA